MSVRWMAWAWEQDCGAVGAKLVLLALADHAGEEGTCWPSTGRLKEKTGMSRATVFRHLGALEEAGLIRREERQSDTGGRVSSHITLLDGAERPPSQNETPPSRNETPPSQNGTPPVSPVRRAPSHQRDSGPYIEPSIEPSVEPPPQPPRTGGSVEQALQSSLEFEEFWALYGRIGPKKVALACWTKARKKASHQEILDGLERWVRYWRSPGAARVKWPQGWLNEERWNDDPPSLAIQAQNRMTPGNQALLALLENHDQG